MIALTTSNSSRVNADERLGGGWERSTGHILSAGPGKGDFFGPTSGTGFRDGGGNPCPLGCSRPKHRNDHSAGRSSGFRLVTARGPPSQGRGRRPQWLGFVR